MQVNQQYCLTTSKLVDNINDTGGLNDFLRDKLSLITFHTASIQLLFSLLFSVISSTQL